MHSCTRIAFGNQQVEEPHIEKQSPLLYSVRAGVTEKLMSLTVRVITHSNIIHPLYDNIIQTGGR